MSTFSRQVVLTSVLAALLVGRMFMVPEIRITMAVAFVVVGAVSWWSTRAAAGIVFGTALIAPALIRLGAGCYYGPEAFVWLAALAALVGVRSWRSPWAIPSPMRWPLSMWALTVALTWPSVALREANFSPGLMQADPRFAGAVWIAASWIATVALNHMLGILWFDWLYRECEGLSTRFVRIVAVPLTASWLVTLVLSVYQSTVDIAFANGGAHVALGRASGGLMDANPFGVCSALWAPIVYLLCSRMRSPWGQPLGIGALALSWFGMWVSGSRGALGTAMICVAAVAIAELRGDARRRRWSAVFLGGAVAVVAAIVAWLPVANSPIHRLMPLFSGFGTIPLGVFLADRWDPYFYGRTAWRMLQDSPFFGIGLGSVPSFIGPFSALLGHRPLEADNAQNWFRHQVAELGVLGSIGWAVWMLCAVWLLWSPSRDRRGGTIAKGVLLATAAVSLIGMPGQNVAFIVVFWTCAFFLSTEVVPAWPAALLALDGWRAAPLAIALTCALGTTVVGWRSYTPALRAARFHDYYAVGVDDTVDGRGHGEFTMHGKRAMVVVQPTSRFLRVSVEREGTGPTPVVVIDADRRRLVSGSIATVSEPEYLTLRDTGTGVVLDARSSLDLELPAKLRVRWEFVEGRH